MKFFSKHYRYHLAYPIYLFPFIVFFGLLWYFPFGLVDDAFIPMVYARNLAHGFGIVFHPQFDPVEGYTSPLWMFGLTIGEWFGISLPALSNIVCVFFGIVGIVLTMRIYQLCFGGKQSYLWSAMVGVALVSDWSYIAWSSAGLETSLFTATLLIISLALIKKWPVIYVFLLLLFLSLIRPEGPAYSLPVFIILWQQKRLHKSSIIKYFSIFFIPFLLFIIWRWIYFGYPLPNSFYAKHDFGGLVLLHRGIEYIRTFFVPRPIFLFIAFIFVLNLKDSFHKSKVLLWMLFTHFLVVILEGGDHFALHRFLMPALPFLYIYLVWSIESLLTRYISAAFIQKSIFIQLIIFILFCSIVTTNAIQVYEYDARDPYRFSNGVRWHFTEVSWVNGWKKIGLWLKEKYPSDTKIAVITAGAIPYFSKLPTIDIVGINNEVIAHSEVTDPERKAVGHEKSNPEYVLNQKPQWVQLFPMLFFSSIPIGEQRLESMLTYPAQIDLWNHNGFHENYKYTIEDTPYGIISYFEQRDKNGE